MAKLHVAQIEYLSQELIDRNRNAYNLMRRGAFELEHAQKSLKMLLDVQDQWVREMELDLKES